MNDSLRSTEIEAEVAAARLKLLRIKENLPKVDPYEAAVKAAEQDAWMLSGTGPGIAGVPPAELGLTPARFGYLASNGHHLNPRHLAVLDKHLIDLAFGKILRLAVMMPPRHGKSERCSRYFPAWFLGRFPNSRVILTSYGDEFATEFGRQARDALSEWGPQLYGVGVRQDSRSVKRWQLRGREGVMRSTGVGGPIVGRGADLFVIDDPLKNPTEALSPVFRENQWNWWLSSGLTRIEPGGRLLVIMQRWHTDDLMGRLLESSKRIGEEWTVLRFPAIADEEDDPLGRSPGEVLWPERWDAAKLNLIRETQDDPSALVVANWWEALYQQRPVPRSGNFFDANWPMFLNFLPYHTVPRMETVRYWDKAASKRTGSARTASVKMSLDATGRFIIEHATFMQAGPAEREEFLRTVAESDGHEVLQIVEQEGGSSGIDSVTATGSNLSGYRFLADRPSGDKITRAEPFADQCKIGNVAIVAGPWNSEYVVEMTSFPFGKRKDLVDASSGAFNYLARTRRNFSVSVGGARTE